MQPGPSLPPVDNLFGAMAPPVAGASLPPAQASSFPDLGSDDLFSGSQSRPPAPPAQRAAPADLFGGAPVPPPQDLLQKPPPPQDLLHGGSLADDPFAEVDNADRISSTAGLAPAIGRPATSAPPRDADLAALLDGSLGSGIDYSGLDSGLDIDISSDMDMGGLTSEPPPLTESLADSFPPESGPNIEDAQSGLDLDESGSALGRIHLRKARMGTDGMMSPEDEEARAAAAEAMAQRAFRRPEPGRILRAVLVASLFLTVAFAGVYYGVDGDFSRLDEQFALQVLGLEQEVFTEGALIDVQSRKTRITAYPGRAATFLIVTGEAFNAGSKPVDGVHAVVLRLSNGEVVESHESPVGVAVPEGALATLTPGDLDSALHRERSAAMAKIAPGEAVAFMVVFPSVPETVTTDVFRVEFRSKPTTHAAAPAPKPAPEAEAPTDGAKPRTTAPKKKKKTKGE